MYTYYAFIAAEREEAQRSSSANCNQQKETRAAGADEQFKENKSRLHVGYENSRYLWLYVSVNS